MENDRWRQALLDMPASLVLKLTKYLDVEKGYEKLLLEADENVTFDQMLDYSWRQQQQGVSPTLRLLLKLGYKNTSLGDLHDMLLRAGRVREVEFLENYVNNRINHPRAEPGRLASHDSPPGSRPFRPLFVCEQRNQGRTSLHQRSTGQAQNQHVISGPEWSKFRQMILNPRTQHQSDLPSSPDFSNQVFNTMTQSSPSRFSSTYQQTTTYSGPTLQVQHDSSRYVAPIHAEHKPKMNVVPPRSLFPTLTTPKQTLGLNSGFHSLPALLQEHDSGLDVSVSSVPEHTATSMSTDTPEQEHTSESVSGASPVSEHNSGFALSVAPLQEHIAETVFTVPPVLEEEDTSTLEEDSYFSKIDLPGPVVGASDPDLPTTHTLSSECFSNGNLSAPECSLGLDTNPSCNVAAGAEVLVDSPDQSARVPGHDSALSPDPTLANIFQKMAPTKKKLPSFMEAYLNLKDKNDEDL